MTNRQLDVAIAAVKAAARDLPRVSEPSDLSGTIGAARELAWAFESLLKTVLDRYEHLDGPLRHDHGNNAELTVDLVRLRLAEVIRRFGDIDIAFDEAHSQAAHISPA